jgi:hypothetical protein
VGQLQAHKHRLASSTAPARSSSPPNSTHGGRCAHHHGANCPAASAARSSCSKCGGQRQRPAASTAAGLRREGSGTQVGQYKPLAMSFSGGAYCAGDVRLMSSSPGGLPQRGLLMAESVNLEDIGKVSPDVCCCAEVSPQWVHFWVRQRAQYAVKLVGL